MVPWEEGVQRGRNLQRKRGGVLRKETTHQGREGWVGQERGWAVRGRGTKETCCRIAVVVVTIVVVAVIVVAVIVVAVFILSFGAHGGAGPRASAGGQSSVAWDAAAIGEHI